MSPCRIPILSEKFNHLEAVFRIRIDLNTDPDPDPDPAFYVITDPGPDSDPGIFMTKMKEKIFTKVLYLFFSV